MPFSNPVETALFAPFNPFIYSHSTFYFIKAQLCKYNNKLQNESQNSKKNFKTHKEFGF